MATSAVPVATSSTLRMERFELFYAFYAVDIDSAGQKRFRNRSGSDLIEHAGHLFFFLLCPESWKGTTVSCVAGHEERR